MPPISQETRRTFYLFLLETRYVSDRIYQSTIIKMKYSRPDSKRNILCTRMKTILGLLLLFPSNYTGKTLQRTGSTDYLPTNGEALDLDIAIDTLTLMAIKDSQIFLACSTVCLFTASLLLILIWKYFNRIPIAFECTLSHLYQDLIAVVIFANWTWYGIVCLYYTNKEDELLTEIQSKYASFIMTSLVVEFLVIFNAIGAIWLYVMKESIRDPPFPWSLNEKKTLNGIRCTIILFVIGTVSLFYYGGFYPKLYFMLSGDLRSLSELSRGPTIFLSFLGLLLIVPVVSIAVSFSYEMKYGEWPSKKRNLAFFTLICIFVLCLLLGHSSNLMSALFGPADFLIIGQVLILISSIVGPSLLIMSKQFLRAYTRRLFDCFSFRVKCVIKEFMTFVREGFQRSHRIHPNINDET